MDTCTVETGLLKKKACGQPSVARCLNCEQALCIKHAVAQLAAGRKTGKFMCKDCDAARIQYEKTTPVAAPAAKAPAAEKPAAAPAAKPAPVGKEPAPAAKSAAPVKEAPKEPVADDAPLEFTPSEKKKE